ncbi:MAG: sodium:solute symporter family protein, partial [Methanomicrobiales archaeon]|nr:sodium:solute symporter family protein [Methanomicrobiales archaeon]
GFGGAAALYGMGLVWLTVFNIGVGIFIAFVIFGKRTREIGQRLSAITFPDLMGKIYNSPILQYITGFIIVVSMPIYAAAVLIGGARFMEPTLGIPYTTALLLFALIVGVYVVFGGLIAVMYTDAFQGTIMLIGMSLLLVLTYVYLGGVEAAHTALTRMADLVPANLAQQGLTGWASMPVAGSPIWLYLITTLVLGVGIGVLAQPQLVVRFMTAKDTRSLNRAVMVGGPFILMMTGVAFTVGALTNVYFFQHGGQIAFAAAGNNVDAVIPIFINQAMPGVFVVIFMVTLLAAAMSTLSSLFHAMGTALICDIWGRGQACALSLKANKAGVVVMMVVSVILAYLLPNNIIALATAMFMGLCASAFLPMFAYSVFAKKPSQNAALWSILTGAVVWLIWAAFVNIRVSNLFRWGTDPSAPTLAQAILGKASLFPFPWSSMDPLVVALPLSCLALVLVWFVRRNPAD